MLFYWAPLQKSAALHYSNVVCWHLAQRGQHRSPFQNVRTQIVLEWKAHTRASRADAASLTLCSLITHRLFWGENGRHYFRSWIVFSCTICCKALKPIWIISESLCFYLVYFLSTSHRQYQINKCGPFPVKLRWILSASNAQPLCSFSSFVKNNAFSVGPLSPEASQAASRLL